MNREQLGGVVRLVWLEWAKEQPNPKPSWLLPWKDLTDHEKEVDRRIGERLVTLATPLLEDAHERIADLERENKRLRKAGLDMLNDYALSLDGVESRQRMHDLLEIDESEIWRNGPSTV